MRGSIILNKEMTNMKTAFRKVQFTRSLIFPIALALVLAGCGGGVGSGSSSNPTPTSSLPITVIPPSGTPTTYYQLGQTIAFDQNWFYFAATNTATTWSNGLAWPSVVDPTAPVTSPIIQSNVLLAGNQAQAEIRFVLQNSGTYTVSFY